MRSGKLREIFKVIMRNSLIPLTFFVFSFANIISCLINPVNYATLAEIVANDIQHIKKEDGLVHLKLEKKKEDFNFIYTGRYYFDEMASRNKKGKEYAILKNYDTTYIDGGLSKDLTIDYGIGIVDTNSFEKLGLKLIKGSVDARNYNDYSKENRCLISKTLASEILGKSDYSSFIGKRVDYMNVSFTIDGVVDDDSFVNKHSMNKNRFIVLRYSRISSSDLNYEYHIYLNPNRYLDNYSIFQRLFANIYRTIEDPYFKLTISNGNWILKDIDWYRANAKSGIDESNSKISIIITSLSAVIGFAVGSISKCLIKRPKSGKESFFMFISGAFLYFGGLFIFKAIFDGKFLNGIHMNVFSGYGVLFAIIYFLILLNLTLVPCVLFEKSPKPTLKELPLVTIIIPVFNGSNYVKLAIESALNQTYKKIEVLVVNDGSTDDNKTRKICLSIEDDRYQYFEKENGGVSSALNYAIDKAKGEYVCWLSHDDILPPKKIEEQLNFVESFDEKKIIPYSKVVVIDKDGNKQKWKAQLAYNRTTKLGGNVPSDYFKFKNLIFSALLVPLDYLKINKFHLDLTYSQDTFAFFEMLKNDYRLVYSRRGAIFYRVHPSQGSFTRVDEINDNARKIDKYFKDYYDETHDKNFMRKYLLNSSIKAAKFNVYKDISQNLIIDRKKYKIRLIDVAKSKVYTFVSKFLYKIKMKFLGR